MRGCLRRFVAVGLHLLLAYLRRWAAPVLLFFCRRWAAPFWVFRSLSPLGCTCFVFLSPLGCTCCWLICAVGLHLFSFFFRRWAAPFGVFRSLSRWAAPALPLKSVNAAQRLFKRLTQHVPSLHLQKPHRLLLWPTLLDPLGVHVVLDIVERLHQRTFRTELTCLI